MLAIIEVDGWKKEVKISPYILQSMSLKIPISAPINYFLTPLKEQVPNRSGQIVYEFQLNEVKNGIAYFIAPEYS